MKYIVKNGKVYGIAVNEWDGITGIPTINNTQLQQGQNYSSADLNIVKQMTKAEYDTLTTKNPECYYSVTTDTTINLPNINYLDADNKPLINNVILTGNKSLRDLNLYSINEIDNMMASLRAIKVVATKPATADIIPNTLYYVGTSAPYHVYLYDSNKTEADLGTSTIDMSAYQKIEDRVDTLNYTAGDKTYPTTSAVFTETPQVRAGHLLLNSATTMDELLEQLFKDGTTRYSTNTTKKMSGYIQFGTAIANMLPAIAGASASFNNGFVEAEMINANNSIFATIRLRCVYSTVMVQNIRGNGGAWTGWQVVNGDAFAPLDSVYVSGDISSFVNPDNAIFNFDKTGIELRHRGQQDFFVQFTDPISNTTFYGSCRTEIVVNNHTQSSSNTLIEQVAKQVNPSSSSGSRIVLRRIGTISGVVDATKITSATISWKDWIPVEYPLVVIPTTSLNTSVVTYGNISYKITGGVLVINFNYLKFATASQSGQVITTNSNFSWIPVTVNCQSVIHGWKTTNIPTSGFVTMSNQYKNITVYDVQADNKEYYGQLVLQLGY